jgi:hypothetical protein
MAAVPAELDLTTLTDWTRRAGGDTVQQTNQTVNSDGSGVVRLKASGSIDVTDVMVGVVTLAAGDYVANGNVIVLNSPPARGVKVTVFYSTSRYSDDQVINFLTDAARGLAGTLKYRWTVDLDLNTVTDAAADKPQLGDELGVVRPEIEELIVLRAGLGVFADKANSAAGNAIKIKDGDTMIDTATTAGASEKAIARLAGQYKDALKKVLVEGFVGSAFDLEEIPPRFQFFYNTYRAA